MIYSEFAKFYDKLMYDFSYEKVYEFIKKVNRDRDVKNVLEMACGTGNLTKLLSRDYKVDAFDLSEDMLSIAENKLRGKVFLSRQDMIDFKMDKNYGLIICCCDSLNYILDISNLKKIFKNVYEHLNEDSFFIFDLNTEEKFLKMKETYVDEVDDIIYIWENDYNRENRVNTYGVNFFKEISENTYKRFYEEHREKAYTSSEVEKILKEVGFLEIKIYDDYSFNEKKDDTTRMTFLVRGKNGISNKSNR